MDAKFIKKEIYSLILSVLVMSIGTLGSLALIYGIEYIENDLSLLWKYPLLFSGSHFIIIRPIWHIRREYMKRQRNSSIEKSSMRIDE